MFINPKAQPTNDQIFKAIERITGNHIVTFQTEANRYSFKTFITGKWETIDQSFVDGIAIFI